MAVKERATKSYGLDWEIWLNDDGTLAYERVRVILLQEIRDELKRLNTLMHCHNTVTIPRELKGLRRDVKALTKALIEREK